MRARGRRERVFVPRTGHLSSIVLTAWGIVGTVGLVKFAPTVKEQRMSVFLVSAVLVAVAALIVGAASAILDL